MAIVKLTQQQIEERAQTIAGLEMRYEDEKASAAEAAKAARNRRDSLREQILTLSREIEAGEVEADDQMEIGNGPDEPAELPPPPNAANVTVPPDDEDEGEPGGSDESDDF